jgi:uncharacterized protein YcfL
MNRMIAIVTLLFVVGCTSHDDPTVMYKNKTTLSKSGEEVGVLPDGRRVVRYELEMGSNIHNHWLYVVDGTITINHTESHGKTTANHVHVVIEGQKYNLVPVTSETDPNR